MARVGDRAVGDRRASPGEQRDVRRGDLDRVNAEGAGPEHTVGVEPTDRRDGRTATADGRSVGWIVEQRYASRPPRLGERPPAPEHELGLFPRLGDVDRERERWAAGERRIFA